MCKTSQKVLYGRHKTRNRVMTIDLDCDSWRCPECADKMVRLHQLRIIEACKNTIGGKWSFLTLTAHEKWRGHDASLANLQQGWRKLTERLRRLNGTRHYVLIHERHDDGTLHVHMLYNGNVSTRWLKDNARQCGMGHQAKSERLKDAAAAGHYVSKYVTKSVSQGDAFPLRFKRVRYSVGFPRFEFPAKPSEYEWVVIAASDAAEYRRQAARAGREVIDRTKKTDYSPLDNRV